MFADYNGGKWLNELEGIENAKRAEPITYEEAMERAQAACGEFVEKLATAFGILAETIAQTIRTLQPFFKLVFEVMENIIETYPNKRVVYLAKHAKKARTRKKNLNRIIKYFEQLARRTGSPQSAGKA